MNDFQILWERLQMILIFQIAHVMQVFEMPKLFNFETVAEWSQQWSNLLNSIRKGFKTWVYPYDVETPTQSSLWRALVIPKPEKMRKVRLDMKIILAF